MERTWKPTTAGILCIIAGAIGVISGIVFAILGGIGFGFFGLGWVSAIMGGPSIILGIIAIIGGICALKRKIWGLALAGSICALPLFVFGIPAIIFVISGKREFERGARMTKEPAEGISPKLRLATTLLAFFLGIFGAHRFYVGKNETASIMLSFSILGLTIFL